MKLRLSACAASAIALALCIGGVQAQDFTRPPNPAGANYFTPVDRWSGFFAGGHAGIVESGKFPNLFGNTKAFEGGVQFGSNVQMGNLVVGAELSATYSRDFSHDLGNGGQLKQSWSGAAKAKAGFAMDSILVYGTLGYGMARLDPAGNVTSGAVNAGGLVFGGGAEMALTEQLSLRLDYTQARYDKVAFTAGGTAQTRDLVDHSLRAGVNFRF